LQREVLRVQPGNGMPEGSVTCTLSKIR